MIAMSVGASWLLLGVVAATLWALWGVLTLTFDMLEQWHRGDRRPRRAGAEEPAKRGKEMESSDDWEQQH